MDTQKRALGAFKAPETGRLLCRGLFLFCLTARAEFFLMTLLAARRSSRTSNHVDHDLAVVLAAGCAGTVRYTKGSTITTDRTSCGESVVAPALT